MAANQLTKEPSQTILKEKSHNLSLLPDNPIINLNKYKILFFQTPTYLSIHFTPIKSSKL